ncbi:MAG: peptidylprolyl isomerase [Planctomycetota bacterium]|nr:peptidylprolyl isomerase [Planctomycetota bacterium]
MAVASDRDQRHRTVAGASGSLLLVIAMLAAGCTSPPQSRGIRTQAGEELPRSEAMTTVRHPAAYWGRDGERESRRAITRSRVDSYMTELAGRVALQEAILDAVLAEYLQERGILVTADDITREHNLLMDVLSEDETEGYRLLDEIRLREGLGPVRFSALLARNAALRRLVEDRVELREEAIFAAWDTLHGPRRVARVIVTPTLEQAREAMTLVREGLEFTEVAARSSTDPSSRAGGLLQPISRLDPSWPTGFRETLWALERGAVSEPVLVDGDYLLVMYVDDVPADGLAFEDGRTEAIEVLRRGQERILMDAEARRMLDLIEVEVIDTELGRAWRQELPGSGL